jgi:2-polyprenyl-3-methyl-5-hydroxy-6-metoxy-1,4-benzoquinol methylase
MVGFGIMTERMKDKAHWAQFAEEWIAWARSPGHDAFWMYRRAFARFVGSGTGNALEVGCGEGRISRELRSLGYRVTATDAVAALVEPRGKPIPPTNMPSLTARTSPSRTGGSI